MGCQVAALACVADWVVAPVGRSEWVACERTQSDREPRMAASPLIEPWGQSRARWSDRPAIVDVVVVLNRCETRARASDFGSRIRTRSAQSLPNEMQPAGRFPRKLERPATLCVTLSTMSTSKPTIAG